MCDEQTQADNARFLAQGMNRRDVGKAAGAVAVVSVLPSPANAAAVREANIIVKTPDGQADCFFVHPSIGRHPAVLIWPDAFGLRPAIRQMARRLAQSGYSVLAINPYYREHKAPVLSADAELMAPETLKIVRGLMASLSPDTNVRDAKAMFAFLDAQASVDPKRKAGTIGYCMGGAMTMRTAAALPARIGAGASFHGGGLATDRADSPHLLIPRMKARYLVAVAANDDERNPQEKDVLRAAFKGAGLPAEIEVYKGALHGWCPPDTAVYNKPQAEKAWARMLALFETALR